MEKRYYEHVRPVTERLWLCLMFDVWPESPAVITDFGISSRDHFGALQYVTRHEDIVSIEKLDELLGDGKAITKAVNVEGNPYKDLVFTTPWDDLKEFLPESSNIEEVNNATNL